MSVFTTVTAEQLSVWLKSYLLGSLIDLQGISAGIENTNYFVTTTRGRYVLTLFEKLSAAQLPFYLKLMAHLATRGVPCPRPISNLDRRLLGELNGKPAAIVTCVPGVALTAPGPGHCALIGTVLADLHVAGSSYLATMPNPRGPSWWKAVLPEIIPFVPAEDSALLREEMRFQATHRLDELPRGAIHADLFRDNVLFDEGQIGGVIDFYFACTDAWLYDLAITVNDWCLAADFTLDRARAAALIGAYRAKRPFTAVEQQAWPVMLRAGALRFWVSRLYDFHLPRPGELTHAKDPSHFRKLLASHAGGLSGIEPLAQAG